MFHSLHPRALLRTIQQVHVGLRGMGDYRDLGLLYYDDNLDYEYQSRHQEQDLFTSYENTDYVYEDEYDYQINEDQGLRNIYNRCVYPTLFDACNYLIPLLIASIIFQSVTQSSYTPQRGFHIISAVIGLYVVQLYAAECLYLLITLITLSYLIFCVPGRYRRRLAISLLCLGVILYGERWMKPAFWHKIRGVTMIASMKAVSVVMESDTFPLPSFLEYIGYMLCPATCLFGPWVSYKDYATLYRVNQWSVRKILIALGYLTLAFALLSISNCWAEWIFPDSTWRWIVAYREALCFRTSHYFISYTSGGLALLGGFSLTTASVTKPGSVELPHSLVQVVVNWNIPMHNWLKTYVFRRSREHFGQFGAVFLTYAVSSLLHGFNFQLAAVLLSLGFYTYVEYQLRQELARAFDACITARRCGDHKCIHKRTTANCWWVRVINILFSALAMFHLAYLGLMFDTSEQQETGYSYSHAMEKWSSLNFASHWVVLATYFAYFMIK
ncbi:protein-serine O-palmitoleoyltransferase porcupine isoform X1 [Neodiprion fabricii]|uniref:protein-serine O-palmitoleoyltransferase porcupine isoform X1 n=1 Tax=Neodiprion fabricii TaxID=2872261 RepID=UPI001ED93711|nr:protein-serine O-palmitoleoyltransferase porcupine isoform X1 [Neodiprion fabricii]